MRLGDKSHQEVRRWALRPLYLRRLAARRAVVTLGLVFTALVMAVLERPLGMRQVNWYAWVRVALGFASLVSLFVLQAFDNRSVRRIFNAANGQLCIHCAYDLSALGDPGRCPECGSAYLLVENARSWQAAGFVVSDDTRPI